MADILAAPRGAQLVTLRLASEDIYVGMDINGVLNISVPIEDSDGYRLGSAYMVRSDMGEYVACQCAPTNDTMATMMYFVSANMKELRGLYREHTRSF